MYIIKKEIIQEKLYRTYISWGEAQTRTLLAKWI